VTGDVFCALIVQDRLQAIRARIERACERSQREASAIALIGACKTVPAARLGEFLRAGLAEVGENYVQEGLAKIAELGEEAHVARWHLIGALQSNKARQAVSAFSLIHSVDRPSLAQALDKAAGDIGKRQDALLQVNLGGEATKAGCEPQNVENLARFCAKLTNLRICGLMCLPPYDSDAERTRPYFRQLREMRDELLSGRLLEPGAIELSMGMSDDFEVAIEEGATMIRIGTALFGERRQNQT